jgi:hypothetical protein
MADDPTRQLGAPSRSLVSVRGAMDVWRPGTGLFVTRVTGHLGIEGAQEIGSLFRRQVAEEGWHIGFHDWSAMETYDSEARFHLTRVAYDLISYVKGGHFFVRSRVVAFGVQAANIVLRRFTLHPTAASFQRQLLEALAKRGSVPPAAAGTGRSA